MVLVPGGFSDLMLFLPVLILISSPVLDRGRVGSAHEGVHCRGHDLPQPYGLEDILGVEELLQNGKDPPVPSVSNGSNVELCPQGTGVGPT